MNTENGLLAVRLISCKAEVMLDIPNNSEEDLTLLVLLCIGAPISSLTNTLKLTLRRVLLVELLLTISTPLESTGMTRLFTLILMMIPTEFCKLTIQLKAIGKRLDLQTEPTLGSTLPTKMHLSIDLTTSFSTLPSEELLDTSRMVSMPSLGLICLKDPLLNSMTTRDNGGLLGETTVLSRSTGSKFGT